MSLHEKQRKKPRAKHARREAISLRPKTHIGGKRGLPLAWEDYRQKNKRDIRLHGIFY